MKLIGEPREFNARTFDIEPFHRVALGLETQTRVYLCALPMATPSPSAFAELLLTTLAPSQWSDLWRLSLNLKEGRGVVADALEVLKQDVNISILETLTTESERYHELLAIVSIADFARRHGQPLGADAIALLQNYLATSLAGILTEVPHLRPLDRLRRAFEDRGRGNLLQVVQSTVDKGRVTFDMAELDRLFKEANPSHGTNQLPRQVIVFSDTEEKYISFYFPRDNQLLLRLSIVHRDQKGAIHSFAKVLHAHGANILSSYSRLQQTTLRAQWKVIADITHVDSCAAILDDLEKCGDYYLDVDKIDIFRPHRFRTPRSKSQEAVLYNSSDFVRRDDMFKGRMDILEEIAPEASLAQGKVTRNAIISGHSKTGKSSLLQSIKRRVQGYSGGTILPIYVSAVESGESFWTHIIFEILEALGGADVNEKGALGRFLQRQNLKKFRLGEMEATRAFTLEYATHVRDGFAEILRLADAAHHNSVLILLDEAQQYLLPSEEMTPLQEIWKKVMNSMGERVQWIVASSLQWYQPSGEIGTKFTPFFMEPLLEDSAKELVEEPFGKMGVRLHPPAWRRITELTNCQPAYIQAICEGIYENLARAPLSVDVISVSDVEQAGDIVVRRYLHQHFAELYRLLESLLEREKLAMLLQGQSVDYNALVGQKWELRLDAVAGLRVSSKRSGERQKVVSATELFSRWAQLTDRVIA
jgi:hypothetical protein